MKPITRAELWHAQLTLLLAVGLQLSLNSQLRVGSRFLVAGLEVLLIVAIGFTAPRRHKAGAKIHRTFSTMMIALISLANAGQLILLINALINGSDIPGKELLTGALAIFITNIIMFGLWFWELDSPGLTGRHEHDTEHFLFPQEEKSGTDYIPTFFDYLYVSLTNSTAFSPTDTMPLTHFAKSLMSAQALISLLTVVLVTARAVNILG